MNRAISVGKTLFPFTVFLTPPWHPETIPTPFDPLAWLASKSTEAFLDPAGQVHLRFGQFVRQEERLRIRRVIQRYLPVLRLQLDVEPGTRPRSVYQLLANGKLKIVEGRYRITGVGAWAGATAS